MITISPIYESQALKPRGTNVKEKLTFLADWYGKASKIDPSDKHQRDFCDLMVVWSDALKEVCSKYDDEALLSYIGLTRASIVSGYSDQYNDNPAEKAFMSYLYIELGRIIE
jgi:hypothetical protein